MIVTFWLQHLTLKLSVLWKHFVLSQVHVLKLNLFPNRVFKSLVNYFKPVLLILVS